MATLLIMWDPKVTISWCFPHLTDLHCIFSGCLGYSEGHLTDLCCIFSGCQGNSEEGVILTDLHFIFRL